MQLAASLQLVIVEMHKTKDTTNPMAMTQQQWQTMLDKLNKLESMHAQTNERLQQFEISMMKHVEDTVRSVRTQIKEEYQPVLKRHEDEIAALKAQLQEVLLDKGQGNDQNMVSTVMRLQKEKEQREYAASVVLETADGADLGSKEKVVEGTEVPVADIRSVSEIKQRVPKQGVRRFVVWCNSATAADRLRIRKQVGACKPMRNRGPVELRESAISRELNACAPSDLRFTFRGGVYMVVRGPMWAPYPMWQHATNAVDMQAKMQLQRITAKDIAELADAALAGGTMVPPHVLQRMQPRTYPPTAGGPAWAGKQRGRDAEMTPAATKTAKVADIGVVRQPNMEQD